MVRTLTVLIVGLALLVIAFLMLDIDLTKRIVALFVVLPVAAICVAFGVWRFLAAYANE